MIKHADSLENFKLKLTKTTQNAGQCSKDYAASSSFIAMGSVLNQDVDAWMPD